MKWFILSAGFAFCLAVSAYAQQQAGSKVVVADFDSPAPNNLQGNFGAFNPSETEQVYTCRETMQEKVRHGDAGSAMKLEYNVSKAGSYNGFWMKLGSADSGNNFDATPFSKLTFWVKGDEVAGFGTRFKIELKGDPGAGVARKYVGPITAGWTRIEIPLKEFKGVDLKTLNEIVFIFEERIVAPATAGAIYIDDVAFEK